MTNEEMQKTMRNRILMWENSDPTEFSDYDFSDCVTCKYKSIDWNEEPCDSCSLENNCYIPSR